MAQDFIRAHGEEQKATRVNQIVDAALALYAELGYDKITFSKLAEGLGFSRINLYNYFKSKEDLFLEIVRREYVALFQDVDESLPNSPCKREVYADTWTSILSRHGRALEMFVLMNMQILRAVPKERQDEFQGYLDNMVGQIAARVSACLALEERDAWAFVAHQINYAMGLYPIALRMHGDGAAEPFSRQYRDFLDILLDGMGIGGAAGDATRVE